MKKLLSLVLLAMFIIRLYSQNVGIGTTSPDNRLHVFKGSAGSVTAFSAAPLVVENSANCYMELLAPNDAATGVLFGKPESNLSGGIFYNDISHNANGFDFRTNGNLTQMVLSRDGNLGIGTLSPTAKLQVSGGSAGAVGYALAPLVVENSTHSYINILAPDDRETGVLFGKPANIGSGEIIYNNASSLNGFQFRTNGGIMQMVLTDNGRLALGATSPGTKFWVSNPDAIHGIFVNNTFQSTSQGLIGIWADSKQGAGYGEGIYGRGGSTGVRGDAEAGNYNGTAYGIIGQAFGSNSAGTRYAVYGFASGGAVNYAGYFDGNVYTTGTYLPSDRLLKEDIRIFEGGLQQLLKLKPATYRYKTSQYERMALPEGRQTGLIADEVKQVFPELVKKVVHPAQYDKDDRMKLISGEVVFEGINYQGLIPVLVAAVQEQQRRIDWLKKENQLLKQHNEAIEKRLEKLETLLRE